MPKLKLTSREDIRTAIQRRGNEIASQLSDREIFQSPEFKRYATKLIDFILRNRKLYGLTLIHDEGFNSITAYTDGKYITANTGNILVKAANSIEKRFKSAMGLLFHEVSHMLFMNFDLSFSALTRISKGKLFGAFDTGGDEALDNSLKEISQIVSTPYAKAISQLYKELWNIVCDGHDENSMRGCYPGFIAECIDAMDEVQYEVSPSLDAFIAKGANTLQIYSKLLLDYCVFGKYKVTDHTPDVDAYLTSMKIIEPTLDEALAEDLAVARWDWLNLLVLQIWPYIRNLFAGNPENQEENGNTEQNEDESGQRNGNGSGQSRGQENGQGDSNGSDQSSGQKSDQSDGRGSGQSCGQSCGQESGQDDSHRSGGNQSQGIPTPDEVSEMLQQAFSQYQQNCGISPAPKNGTGTGFLPNEISASTPSDYKETNIQAIVDQIAQQRATHAIQHEMDEAQLDAIRNANYPLIHQKTMLDVKRHFTPYQHSYEKILDRVKPYLKRLIQQSQLLVDEMNDDYVQKHRRFGPIVRATDAYRPDNAFFAKRKLPDEVPDMAICILIDCSTSMTSNHKLEHAVEAAILIERYANAMGIPIMIATHSVTIQGHVNLHIYTDFVSTTPDDDRFALAGIEPQGRNRDGVPIRACCELLAKRSEDVKLMINLSDGAPNDGPGYKGVYARKDVQDAVKEYRRKGLIIFGAAIDKDRNIIEEIYGNYFLSIDNLATLPKTLVRIIKRHMTE